MLLLLTLYTSVLYAQIPHRMSERKKKLKRLVSSSLHKSVRSSAQLLYLFVIWKKAIIQSFCMFLTRPQVAQARNMSIGVVAEHSKYKDLYGEKTYRFCNLRKWKDFNKKQLTLLKMCVTSLLCGPLADLWPFYGFACRRFSLFI